VDLDGELASAIDPDRPAGKRGRGRCSEFVRGALVALYERAVGDAKWATLDDERRGAAQTMWRQLVAVEGR
jgi:hypothetical protein